MNPRYPAAASRKKRAADQNSTFVDRNPTIADRISTAFVWLPRNPRRNTSFVGSTPIVCGREVHRFRADLSGLRSAKEGTDRRRFASD
jgi:hypothetical protein